MAWHLFEAKPVSEPMVASKLDLWEQISIKFKSKYNKFQT